MHIVAACRSFRLLKISALKTKIPIKDFPKEKEEKKWPFFKETKIHLKIKRFFLVESLMKLDLQAILA